LLLRHQDSHALQSTKPKALAKVKEKSQWDGVGALIVHIDIDVS